MCVNQDTISHLRVVCFLSADSEICCVLHSHHKVMKKAAKILSDITGSSTKVASNCLNDYF